MRIAIPKENFQGETRVAASPDTVKKYASWGATVSVQKGAGLASSYTDEDYKAVGAEIAKTAEECVKNADVILRVRSPLLDESGADFYPKGAALIAMLDPYADKDQVTKLGEMGLSAFALELIPRISRAQNMDVLSSQSNLAGYKAVIDAAATFGRAFPMMMTAAGTVPPARVFVLGAGVAGLQAIATAKRLGAVVSAFDVRAAAAEQVQSLGGTFVEVEGVNTENAETEGGYAKEMQKDAQALISEKIAEHIKTQDIVITTALIPGKPAPVLVTEDMVKTMKTGAVIVDLAVERGGNCPLSKPGKIVTTKNGIHIMGYTNLPGRLAGDASRLFARNVQNFLELLLDKDHKAIELDREDEIIAATLLTEKGGVVHKDFGAQQQERQANEQ